MEHKRFKEDLNIENKDGSNHAEVTIMFIKFLHTMWNKNAPKSKYSWDKDVYSPSPLQRAIGKINDMFKGAMQNDKPKIIMPNSFKMLDYSDETLQNIFDEAHLK